MASTTSLAARAARRLLSIWGWRADVEPLPGPKGVIVVYPHTSNWDFVWGYLAKTAAGLEVQFVGKDSLFRWPFGALFRWLGGIPVNRRARTGFVEQLVREYGGRERVWIALAPEGTRSASSHWKSGFWHLAIGARVPIGLAYIDYPSRTVALRTYLVPTGDAEADLAGIRKELGGARGKFPELAAEIRFQDE